MTNSSEWLTDFIDKLKRTTKDLSVRNYRFLQIRRLAKMAEKVDEFSTGCRDCFFFKNDLSRIVANPENFPDNPTLGNKEYEKTFALIFRHLKKTHKLCPKSYFASLYSLLGMVFGILAGLLIAYMIYYIQEESTDILKTGILLGWVIGLIVGQILGKMRDSEIKKQDLQL